jgi:hypothetical protein
MVATIWLGRRLGTFDTAGSDMLAASTTAY